MTVDNAKLERLLLALLRAQETADGDCAEWIAEAIDCIPAEISRNVFRGYAGTR